MGAHFQLQKSPLELEAWFQATRRQIYAIGQVITYDSGNVPLLVVRPLGSAESVAIVMPLDADSLLGQVQVEELIVDELAARSQQENTSVPRFWAYLRYIWAITPKSIH